MLRRTLVLATVLCCLVGYLGAPVVAAGTGHSDDGPVPAQTSLEGDTRAAPGTTVTPSGTAGSGNPSTRVTDLTSGEVTNVTAGVANVTVDVTNATVETTGGVLALAGIAPNETAAGSPGVSESTGDEAEIDVTGQLEEPAENRTTGSDGSDAPGSVGESGSTPTGNGTEETSRIDAAPTTLLLNETLQVVGSVDEVLLPDDAETTQVLNGSTISDTPGPDDSDVASNGSVASNPRDVADAVDLLRAVIGVTDEALTRLLVGLAPGELERGGPASDRGESDIGLADPGDPVGDRLVTDVGGDDDSDGRAGDGVEPTPGDDENESGPADGGAGGEGGGGADSDDASGGAGGSDPGDGAGAGAAALVTVGCLGGSRAAVDGTVTLASPASRTALASVRQAVGFHFGEWADRFLPVVFGSSRLADSEVLENDTRAQIYDLVRASPGTYHAQLADETGVTEETVRYHCRVLVDEGLLQSEKHRGRRRLYPLTTGDDDPELAAAMADSAASDVLSAVRRREPTTLSSIAETLDRAPSTVAHHLDRLEADGLVSRERDGGSVTVELRTATRSALESTVADD